MQIAGHGAITLGFFAYDQIKHLRDISFTPGDVLYKDNLLYICKSETQEVPTLGRESSHWESYASSGTKYVNSLQELNDVSPDKIAYVGPEALKQFIDDRMKGLSSGGTIKVLSDPSALDIHELNVNSSVRLDENYISRYAGPLPISKTASYPRVVIIRTTGLLKTNGSNGDQVIQELLEITSSSVRTFCKSSFGRNTWVPMQGGSFDSDYVDQFYELVSDLSTARQAYDDFVNESSTRYAFQEVGGPPPGQNTFSIEKRYWKFSLSKISGKVATNLVVDITPDDFELLESLGAGSTLKFDNLDPTVELIYNNGFYFSRGTYGSPIKVLKADKLIL